MAAPQETYLKRLERMEKLARRQGKTANRFSNLRLITFVTSLVSALLLYRYSPAFASTVLVAGLAGFIYFVRSHHSVLASKKLSSALQEINRDGLQRQSGDWTTFADTGEEFRDQHHPYSGDLDIFGKGSLFQLINVTQTYLGREKLKQLLVAPAKDDILRRQEAVAEISRLVSWRQRLTAEGRIVAGKLRDPEPLFNWAREKNNFYRRTWVKYLFHALPVCTCLLILAHFWPGIPLWIPVLALTVQFILLTLKGKDRSQAFNTVYSLESSLKIYANILRLVENKRFHSQLLCDLQAGLTNKRQQTAYRQVQKLSKLVDSLGNRNNAMFFFINILTLWDYHCMIALEEWREESGRLLGGWLTAVGEVEAMASLALLKYDNPEWTFPEVSEEPPLFSASALGHPLLTRGRVANDLRVGASSGILLITGSNMSGKSTLLRTAGINLVLAYAGGPVCAQKLRCSLMNLYTCMRVSDNLEQNVSSFYAELLRIKTIVQAAKTEQQVFFLLDEIFKGTNSEDRHAGAKLLIRQLAKQGALGLVSTHDLELGALEKDSGGKIRNYHFREYYRNNEIHFDYKLRPGLSTTRNALYLIKLAGIETSV